MKQHVYILGWTHIILGTFGIILAVILGIFLAGIGLISGDQTANNIMLVIAVIVGGFSALVSIPGVIAGIGLLGTRRWARVLTIILGILNLPGFPIGTLLGIYSLYVMLDDETSTLF
jgi:hypothetical protein